MTVVELLPGCYVWMASLVLLPVAALWSRFLHSGERRPSMRDRPDTDRDGSYRLSAVKRVQ